MKDSTSLNAREKSPTICLSMHVTRPKSSKGRSRQAVCNNNNNNECKLLHAGDPGSNQRPPPPPTPPPLTAGSPDRNPLRSQSQPGKRPQQAAGQGQLSREEVLEMMRHGPTTAAGGSTQSLNKYKVLPSIESRRQAQGEHRLSRETDLPIVNTVTQKSSSEVPSKPPDPTRTQKVPSPSGSLLLAIRAPCGRRSQLTFDPTDTLQTVKAGAEVEFGAEYRDVCIQTMDVPRRTFTDMSLTLDQCGIVGRSVLCITHNDSSSNLSL